LERQFIGPRGGGTPHHAGPTGEHQGGAQAERVRGDMGQSLHLRLPWEATGGAGERCRTGQ
jgi:hypothetical protein